MNEFMMGGSVSPSKYFAYGTNSAPYFGVIDIETGDTVSTPTMPGTVRSMAVNNQKSILALPVAGNGALRLLNTSDFSLIPGTPSFAGTGYAVDFSPDGSLLALGTNVALHIIELATLSVLSSTNLPGTAQGVAFNPDGSEVVVGHLSAPYITTIDPTTGSVVTAYPAGVAICRDCKFTNTGEYLLTLQETEFRIYDASAKTLTNTLTLSSGGRSISVSSDNDATIAIANAPYLKVLNLDTLMDYQGVMSLSATSQASCLSRTGDALSIVDGSTAYIYIKRKKLGFYPDLTRPMTANGSSGILF